MIASDIERLIQLLAKLPGLGPRSARRAALHLIKRREILLEPLVDALAEVSEKIRTCGTCVACCVYQPVPELDKAAFVPCPHLSRRVPVQSRADTQMPLMGTANYRLPTEANCTIYPERPACCQSYRCEWLRGVGAVVGSFGRIMAKRRAFMKIKKRRDGELLTSGEIYMFPHRMGGGPLTLVKRAFEGALNAYWRLVRPLL